jgi:hypothetical protein
MKDIALNAGSHSYVCRNNSIFLPVQFILRPASWPGGQDSCLLDMRSRVRFPILPWEFSLIGDDPHGGLGLGSL